MLTRVFVLSFFLPLTRGQDGDPIMSSGPLGSGATPAAPPVQILGPEPANTDPSNIAGDLFGASFSISGNILVVGSPFHNNEDGAVFTYRLSQEEEQGWILEDTLILPDEDNTTEMVDLGQDVTPGTRFGWMVAAHGENTLVVTSRVLHRVDVFKLLLGDWSHIQTIEGPEDALFGDDLALTDTHLAIKRSNALEVYIRNSSGMFVKQQSIAPSDSDWRDEGSAPLMAAIVMQSNVLAIAVEDNSEGTVAKSKGSVRVYVLDDLGYFRYQHRLVLPDGVPGDRFGKYIAMEGEHLVVSTTQEREQIAVFHPCSPDPTALLPLAGSVTLRNGLLAMRRGNNIVTFLTQTDASDPSSPWEGLLDWTLTEFSWFAPMIYLHEETLVLSNPLAKNANTGSSTGAVYLVDMRDDETFAATKANRPSSSTVATCPTAQHPVWICGTGTFPSGLIIIAIILVGLVGLGAYCFCSRRIGAATATETNSDEGPSSKQPSYDPTTAGDVM